MQDTEMRWGIIGCGDVTEVKSGPAFNKVPHSKLVAVMRRDASKAADYAKRHGVPVWYADASSLINDPKVNAIYVATPPSSHEMYAVQALRAGKPVYLEKPMTTDAVEAKRIAAIVTETGGKLCVAHYRRRQPLFLKVKELLRQNAIGEVRMVNLQLFQPDKSAMITQTADNWRVNPAISGGGLFHDLAPHQLDLMLYFFGKPGYVSGISLNQAAFYAADDITTGHIIFPNDVVFSGTWCFNVPSEERKDHCEIIGSRGRISFSVFAHQQLSLTVNGGTQVIAFDKLEHVQQPMIEKVVSYFRGEADNPCTAEEGVMVMEMIDAIAKSKVKA